MSDHGLEPNIHDVLNKYPTWWAGGLGGSKTGQGNAAFIWRVVGFLVEQGKIDPSIRDRKRAEEEVVKFAATVPDAPVISRNLQEVRNACLFWESRSSGVQRIHTSKPTASNEVVMPSSTAILPANKILYGPPGTGKTYSTINEAMRILDAPFLAANATDRAGLKKRFDALVQAGLIRFVTFHQSFSYEDFVEGIGASTDETTKSLRYEVEDGVFKQICEAARSRTMAETGSGIDIAGRKIWKISLGDANTEGHIFDECMEAGIALMGFGFGADLTGVSSREDIVERVHAANQDTKSTDYAITALDQFVRRVHEGDLIVVTHGNLKFRAIGEVTGEYQHIAGEAGEHYVQSRPVRWLRQYDPPRPYADLMENRFSQMTIYELRSGSINLDRLAVLLAPEQADEHEPEARVLIIDEINRGNVSRIFGELITLIEPSKREGCAEALEVTLPYSKERFSVPSNVHLIGTMNTADRSLGVWAPETHLAKIVACRRPIAHTNPTRSCCCHLR